MRVPMLDAACGMFEELALTLLKTEEPPNGFMPETEVDRLSFKKTTTPFSLHQIDELK